MTDTTNSRTGHVNAADVEWQDMGDGTTRMILGYEPQMLMMRNVFESGVEGPLHSHPHVQSSYVVNGVFEITIGDQTQQLAAGDGFLVPGGITHGARCIQAGEIVEVFTPIRDEFV